MVVGDPHQLRFVSFLPKAAETASFARHEISAARQATHRFSRRSLFDVADDVVAQRHSHMLDEHFRCQPQIIHFSNDEFYGRTIRVMTERPHSQGAKSVFVHHVEGRRESGAKTNKVEIDAVIDIARAAVAEAERGGPIKSLGLLSPYREQTNTLEKTVAETFTPEQVTRHKIVCGTAHSLQGDERDIVVLSTVIDRDYNPNSLRFLEDPNLFNVAITRAAERLDLVTSVRLSDLPAGDRHYLSKFLRHAETVVDPERNADLFRSDFERDVCAALRDRGLRVLTNYPSCGYEIDLVVSNAHRSVAVECDGHPSHFQANGSYTIEDIQRHTVLLRAGWTIHRIPLSSWRADPARHLDMIVGLLEHPPARKTRAAPALPAPRASDAVVAQPEVAKPMGRAVATPPVAPRKGPGARPTTPTTNKPAKKKTARSGGGPARVPVTQATCNCGGRWVMRSGPYGKFFGCSRFPRCRRTRPYQ